MDDGEYANAAQENISHMFTLARSVNLLKAQNDDLKIKLSSANEKLASADDKFAQQLQIRLSELNLSNEDKIVLIEEKHKLEIKSLNEKHADALKLCEANLKMAMMQEKHVVEIQLNDAKAMISSLREISKVNKALVDHPVIREALNQENM